MTEIVKICKVHGELPKSETHIHAYHTKTYYSCKICCNEKNKKYRESKRALNLQQKQCVNHGLITKENIDKWGRCILCRRKHNMASYASGKDKWISKTPEYLASKRTPEKTKLAQKRYKEKDIERYLALRRAKQKRNVEGLGDDFVKLTLQRKYGFNRKDLTNEIIELERARLAIRRIIKKAKNDST